MVFPGVLRGLPGPRLATAPTNRPRRSLSSPWKPSHSRTARGRPRGAATGPDHRARPGSASDEPGEQLVETRVRLVQAPLHARAQHAVALLGGVEDRDRGELRAVAEILEGGGLDGHVSGHALPLEGLRDALGRRDLAVGAPES